MKELRHAWRAAGAIRHNPPFTKVPRYCADPLRSESTLKIALALLAMFACTGAVTDSRLVVQRAFESVLAAGGFRGHAEGNVFGPGLPALSGDVDVVFPDRIRVRSDNLEFIALSDRAWVNTFGLWTPADRSLLPITAFDAGAMHRAIASMRDVRPDGTQRTAQCAAHIFAMYSIGQLPGVVSQGHVRAWICDDSGRLARVEATDANTGERVTFDFDWARRPDVGAPR
jgi:hypothetical protein